MSHPSPETASLAEACDYDYEYDYDYDGNWMCTWFAFSRIMILLHAAVLHHTVMLYIFCRTAPCAVIGCTIETLNSFSVLVAAPPDS